MSKGVKESLIFSLGMITSSFINLLFQRENITLLTGSTWVKKLTILVLMNVLTLLIITKIMIKKDEMRVK